MAEPTRFVASFVLSLALVLSGACAAKQESFTVAVVPQFTPTQVHRDWAPVLARLEQATGYRFQLRVYDRIPNFETELAQAIPDLAFMNPYHMVLAKQSHDYRPLVRDGAPLTGILVVRRDGPIKKLADLNGKVLSFPSPNALGASLYMRALLVEQEGIKFTALYSGNHQNVYRQVLLGEAQAGGGVRATLNKEPQGVQTQMHILYTTPELAPHPIAAHPRVPLDAQRKIVDALLAMAKDPEAQKLLAAVQLPQLVEAEYQRDYASLARLKLERYAVKANQ